MDFAGSVNDMSIRWSLLVVAGGVAAVLCSTPPAQASPDTDAQQAMTGDYRVVLSTGEERTWNIRPGCASPAPCVVVVGNGRAAFDATLSDGRWSFQIPYPVNMTCSSPPVTRSTWSWDAATLAGNLVQHIAAGCGQPERDETQATLTLTKIA